MSCIALSIATEGLARPFWPGPTALRSLHGSPSIPCSGTAIPVSLPVSPRAPGREKQAAPGGAAGFCFPGLLPQSQCGSPSQKAALGAWERPSLASVPAECPE
jgi:hypothetical protein